MGVEHVPAYRKHHQSVGETSFSLPEDGNGVDICGWQIRNVQNAIATTSAEETLSQKLGIKLPGMLFDKSVLHLSFKKPPATSAAGTTDYSFDLTFCAVDALKMVGEADPTIKVKAAESWDSKAERSDVEITTIERASDWTFSTRYPGTVLVNGESYDDLKVGWCPGESGNGDEEIHSAHSGQLESVDYDALRRMDIPILFSTYALLFEDELDDNGTASYAIRIRVMPQFFFILARFFLRVDGVLVRIYDTRYFHKFGTGIVVRETTTREGNLAADLRDLEPSVLRDPDLAAQKLSVVATKLENIRILP